jgi:hypothetical protein
VVEANWTCSFDVNLHKSICSAIVIQEDKQEDGTTNSETDPNVISDTTTTTVNAAIGAVMLISAALAICNISTPQGLWMTMNQFQLILLLLLTNSYISESIVSYLTGLKAST